MRTASQFDVAIAGAGPAGSSLAIRLAQQGLKVLLVEQKQFPRDKLCGEFVSPECMSHFEELKVSHKISAAGGSQIMRTVFYSQNGSSVSVPSVLFGTGKPALGLSRARMDECLRSRARAEGVEVWQTTQASSLLSNENKVIGLQLKDESGHKHEAGALLTVDATGRSRTLARQFDTKKKRRADYVAFKTHLEGVDINGGDCEIYSYRGGYGGCISVENNRQNLCFIVSAEAAKRYSGDAEEIMRNFVFRNKKAAATLSTARVAADWQAVAIESYGRSYPAPAAGLLAVGDSAGFIDPFTGSGILMALDCSKLAADLIGTGRHHCDLAGLALSYSKAYEREFMPRFRTGKLLRLAAFAPVLATLAVRTMSMSDKFTRAMVRGTR